MKFLKYGFFGFLALLVLGLFVGDARAITTLPEVQALRGELQGYPEYSIQLLGLREDQGKFYHQFKAVWMDPAAAADSRVGFRVTDWSEISEDQFRDEKDEAGKVILARRANGVVDSTVVEPAALYASNTSAQGARSGISAGDVAAYLLMAEILDEAGDALERNHRYRKYDTRYRTPSAANTYRSPSAATPPAGFNGRVESRMNKPGVGATAAQPATGSFADRVESRMNRPGVASTPTTATSSRPGAPAARESFADRVRSRMNKPGASSTPSYSAPSRSSTPSYSAPSRSSGGRGWGGGGGRRGGRRRG